MLARQVRVPGTAHATPDDLFCASAALACPGAADRYLDRTARKMELQYRKVASYNAFNMKYEGEGHGQVRTLRARLPPTLHTQSLMKHPMKTRRRLYR